MHRRLPQRLSLTRLLRAQSNVHGLLYSRPPSASAPFLQLRQLVSTQAEADRAIKAALQEKNVPNVINCFNKLDGHGFLTQKTYDILIPGLARLGNWNALFYVVNHKSTQSQPVPFTARQLVALIDACHRCPASMWREAKEHLQELLALGDKPHPKTVVKVLELVSRTKDEKPMLEMWDLVFKHRDQLEMSFDMITHIGSAIFRSGDSQRMEQLLQMLCETHQLPWREPRVDILTETMHNATSLLPTWLPVAMIWLIDQNKVADAMKLFADKVGGYPGDVALQSVITMAKLSESSNNMTAAPVVFQCVEYLLEQPELGLTTATIHALVHACESLQNYPLAARVLLTGEAQGVRIDEGSLVRLGRMLLRAEEYEANLELMKDRFMLNHPDSTNVQSLMLVSLFRLGRVQEMATILQNMFEGTARVPILVYQVSVYGFCFNRYYEQAADLVQTYIDQHQPQDAPKRDRANARNAYHLNSAILLTGMYACAQGRLKAQALALLQQVSRANTKLSRRDEVKFVEYACRACGGSDPELLGTLLEELSIRFNDAIPNRTLFLTCAALCAHENNWSAAFSFLDKMRKNGHVLDLQSYLDLFSNLQDLKRPVKQPTIISPNADGLGLDSSDSTDTEPALEPISAADLDEFIDAVAAAVTQDQVNIDELRKGLHSLRNNNAR